MISSTSSGSSCSNDDGSPPVDDDNLDALLLAQHEDKLRAELQQASLVQQHQSPQSLLAVVQTGAEVADITSSRHPFAAQYASSTACWRSRSAFWSGLDTRA